MIRFRRSKPLLGTFVEIGVYAAEETAAMQAMDAAFAKVQLVQNLLSFHDEKSDLSKLNLAGGKCVTLHPLSMRVLRLAKALTQQSGHRFNCTVGGAMTQRKLLPSHQQLFATHGTADDLLLDRHQAQLKNNIAVTLDGIAKGYAVDAAVAELKRSHIQHGWISAGGDTRVFGIYTLPIALALHNGSTHFVGHLKNASIATSHTIAQPERGHYGEMIHSENNEQETWSVISRYAWRADALTKVAACTAPHERVKLLEKLQGSLVYPA